LEGLVSRRRRVILARGSAPNTNAKAGKRCYAVLAGAAVLARVWRAIVNVLVAELPFPTFVAGAGKRLDTIGAGSVGAGIWVAIVDVVADLAVALKAVVADAGVVGPNHGAGCIFIPTGPHTWIVDAAELGHAIVIGAHLTVVAIQSTLT
jgi:hypothetical protein